MNNLKHFGEITSLRIQAGLTFNELASKVGYSKYWLRKQIKEGNEKIINKTKLILSDELS